MTQLGWVRDDDVRDAYTAELERVYGASDRPELKGFWAKLKSRGVTEVLLQHGEQKVTGRNRPRRQQTGGICVECGTGNAILDSYLCRLARGVIGTPVSIYTAPIYIGAREYVARKRRPPPRWLNGEGAVGADAAEFVATRGICTLEEARQTTQREDISLGQRTIPADVLALSKTHLVRAHRCHTVADIADANAAEYGVAFCCGRLWTGRPDADGMSRPNDNGGHCVELAGVFDTPNGDDGFVMQNSWIPTTSYANRIRTSGGWFTLRDGCHGVYADEVARALSDGGEAWAFTVEDGMEWRE